MGARARSAAGFRSILPSVHRTYGVISAPSLYRESRPPLTPVGFTSIGIRDLQDTSRTEWAVSNTSGGSGAIGCSIHGLEPHGGFVESDAAIGCNRGLVDEFVDTLPIDEARGRPDAIDNERAGESAIADRRMQDNRATSIADPGNGAARAADRRRIVVGGGSRKAFGRCSDEFIRLRAVSTGLGLAGISPMTIGRRFAE